MISDFFLSDLPLSFFSNGDSSEQPAKNNTKANALINSLFNISTPPNYLFFLSINTAIIITIPLTTC